MINAGAVLYEDPHVVVGVTIGQGAGAAGLRRGFPRRFMSRDEAQTSRECLRPQTTPAFAPAALQGCNQRCVAFDLAPARSLCMRARGSPQRGYQCPLGSESDGGAALPQSVGMGHYRKSGAGPSNAPRSIFLLSGQSYRLILSCRNEIAESLLARSGGVHAVGGQTLDL